MKLRKIIQLREIETLFKCYSAGNNIKMQKIAVTQYEILSS